MLGKSCVVRAQSDTTSFIGIASPDSRRRRVSLTRASCFLAHLPDWCIHKALADLTVPCMAQDHELTAVDPSSIKQPCTITTCENTGLLVHTFRNEGQLSMTSPKVLVNAKNLQFSAELQEVLLLSLPLATAMGLLMDVATAQLLQAAPLSNWYCRMTTALIYCVLYNQ